MTVPAVSVVMAVYNGERFLRAAVESVLVQTLTDFELIVVDDGSTDSTPEILTSYAAVDPRVAVLRQSNQGEAVSLNRAIARARAPLIARLDADDVALPRRLECQFAYLANNPAVATVGGAVTYIDENDRAFSEVIYPLYDREIRAALEVTTPFVHSAVMFRKSTFLRAGGYRASFVPAEDVDLWLRMGEHGEFANLEETVVRYRMHGGQVSVRRLESQTLASVGARLAGKARLEDGSDPFDRVERIDRRTLLAMGATEGDITAALVNDGTWLAKTLYRAGYTDAGEQLFEAALERSKAASGSPALRAHVMHERARVQAEANGLNLLHASFIAKGKAHLKRLGRRLRQSSLR